MPGFHSLELVVRLDFFLPGGVFFSDLFSPLHSMLHRALLIFLSSILRFLRVTPILL